MNRLSPSPDQGLAQRKPSKKSSRYQRRCCQIDLPSSAFLQAVTSSEHSNYSKPPKQTTHKTKIWRKPKELIFLRPKTPKRSDLVYPRKHPSKNSGWKSRSFLRNLLLPMSESSFQILQSEASEWNVKRSQRKTDATAEIGSLQILSEIRERIRWRRGRTDGMKSSREEHSHVMLARSIGRGDRAFVALRRSCKKRRTISCVGKSLRKERLIWKP